MSNHMALPAIREPSYVVDSDGHPTAVLVDLDTWRALLARLEDIEDRQLLDAAAPEIAELARGKRPEGWMTWEAFEAELEALETAGELPA